MAGEWRLEDDLPSPPRGRLFWRTRILSAVGDPRPLAPDRREPANRGWDDVRLVEAVKTGDADALEVLYQRHAPLVLGLCRRILGHSPEAEEALLNVFHQLWERADHYDPSRATPIAFLAMIARSRAIDRLRLRNRSRALSLPIDAADEALLEEVALSASGASGPYDDALGRERGERVRAALAELAEAQRETLELSFYRGMTHREIAKELSLPLGTVKTRIRQGLLRMRAELRGEEDDS